MSWECLCIVSYWPIVVDKNDGSVFGFGWSRVFFFLFLIFF
ncbi:hypothetical protein C497_02417 [Halalkalicoccus jeotgali B3]|uniref:Uncharacterized protein n=1 Tax=Halalkalicoccus jeotgali (strain DSM 18796 / CECT 7217 / JCM 14584 / KCTC 4019 / B3) TaxID=795797 RepID=D8JBW5_HALJB|nr:hypothetical protein HacjB3_17091 [Halalkalicoccus jeotgali B3]ELY40900.1 hypothetical protein C497_02417 [Halalkalicoccus jeotgali B3]